MPTCTKSAYVTCTKVLEVPGAGGSPAAAPPCAVVQVWHTQQTHTRCSGGSVDARVPIPHHAQSLPSSPSSEATPTPLNPTPSTPEVLAASVLSHEPPPPPPTVHVTSRPPPPGLHAPGPAWLCCRVRAARAAPAASPAGGAAPQPAARGPCRRGRAGWPGRLREGTRGAGRGRRGIHWVQGARQAAAWYRTAGGVV